MKKLKLNRLQFKKKVISILNTEKITGGKAASSDDYDGYSVFKISCFCSGI